MGNNTGINLTHLRGFQICVAALVFVILMAIAGVIMAVYVVLDRKDESGSDKYQDPVFAVGVALIALSLVCTGSIVIWMCCIAKVCDEFRDKKETYGI